MAGAAEWEAVLERLEVAAKLAGLDSETHELLRTPERVLEVAVPVHMDDGRLEVFRGWRVHHSTKRGPAKGGLRFHPALDVGTLSALAATMTLKTALADLPFGGAKGGVRCDPAELTLGELERLTRRFTWEILPLLGPDRDIPAPDVNTDDRVMGWVMDTYACVSLSDVPGCVTGKPLALGGSSLHQGSTASGVVTCTRSIFEAFDLSPVGSRVVIQGFGKVGRPLATLLSSVGMRVIGVSDVAGAVYNPAGLDIQELARHVNTSGTVAGFPIGDTIEIERLWELDCELVVPAALSGAIDGPTAERLGGKIVVEAANAPLTLAADDVLYRRGVVVVPDILASSGGVIASYFEWAQNRQGYRWDDDLLAERLRRAIEVAFNTVNARADTLGVDLRRAASVIAVERVAAASRSRGFFP